MVDPLPPGEIANALQRGSQDELDEFHRLVEKAHLEILDPGLLSAQDQSRLRLLRDKLFPAPQPSP